MACNSLDDSSADVIDMGVYSSIQQKMYIQARDLSSNFRSAIYHDVYYAQGSSSSSQGLFVANRTSSSSLTVYKDGSSVGSASGSAGSVINNNIFFLAANSAGNDSDNSSRKYNLFCVGQGISNISDFNSDVATLLSKI